MKTIRLRSRFRRAWQASVSVGWVAVIFLQGCGLSSPADEKPESLYRQRIENSSFVLYDYCFRGAFAFSDDIVGVTILDSNEAFSRSKVDALPLSCFAAKPKPGNFELIAIGNLRQGVTQPEDTSLAPIRRYVAYSNEVPFTVTEYHDTYGSATKDTGLMRYKFDSIRETADSLTFFQVSKTFGGRVFPATTSFCKGNIWVMEDADQNIERIVVKQAVIGRGSIYKPTAPLQLVLNQPVVGMATYEFYPNRTLSSKALTDYGLWKRVI